MFRLEKLTSHSSHRISPEFLNLYINTVIINTQEISKIQIMDLNRKHPFMIDS